MRALRGFTLVELLVALALMAVLAGLAWQGLGGVADAKRTSDARVNETLPRQAGQHRHQRQGHQQFDEREAAQRPHLFQ